MKPKNGIAKVRNIIAIIIGTIVLISTIGGFGIYIGKANATQEQVDTNTADIREIRETLPEILITLKNIEEDVRELRNE